MTTTTELRDLLVKNIEHSKIMVAEWQWTLALDEARLIAHDKAIAARLSERLSPATIGPGGSIRKRKRNLLALVLEQLTAEPQTVDQLVAAVGDISMGRMQDVLRRLRTKSKAFQPPGSDGWVHHPSLLVHADDH